MSFTQRHLLTLNINVRIQEKVESKNSIQIQWKYVWKQSASTKSNRVTFMTSCEPHFWLEYVSLVKILESLKVWSWLVDIYGDGEGKSQMGVDP